MKKRTSKDKEIKRSIDSKNHKLIKSKATITPLASMQLLVKRAISLGYIRSFEKSQIEQIAKRGSIKQLRFRQFTTSLQEQEFLRKDYSINDIKHIFTDLIQKSSQTKYNCFLNFRKLQDFKIMRRYRIQQKLMGSCGKQKDQVNQTASRSVSEARQCQQMRQRAQKVLTRPDQSRKGNQNSSVSEIQYIVKGIQKMIKNHTKEPESPQIKQMDFKPILPNNQMSIPDISRIHSERVHTTPEMMTCDNYGLGQYLCPKDIKPKIMTNSSRLTKIQQKNDYQKSVVRFHTEYDTQYITQPKKTKSKSKPKLNSFSKKSFSKKKPFEKAKSPVGMRMGLKLKK